MPAARRHMQSCNQEARWSHISQTKTQAVHLSRCCLQQCSNIGLCMSQHLCHNLQVTFFTGQQQGVPPTPTLWQATAECVCDHCLWHIMHTDAYYQSLINDRWDPCQNVSYIHGCQRLCHLGCIDMRQLTWSLSICTRSDVLGASDISCCTLLISP